MGVHIDLGHIMPMPNLPSTGSTGPSHPTAPGDTIKGSGEIDIPSDITGEPSPHKPLSNYSTAGTPGTTGPKGTGNPWLVANPLVALTIAYLDMFATMRDAKVQTGISETKQIGVDVGPMPKQPETLPSHAAQQESQQYITDAIMSGVQMGISLVSAAVTIGSFAKSMGKTPEIEQDEKEVNTAKTSRNTAQEEVNTEQTNLDEVNADIKTNQKNLAAAEGKVGSDPAAADPADAEKAQKFQKEQTELQGKQQEIKTRLQVKKDNLAKADENLNAKQEQLQHAQNAHQQKWQKLIQISQPITEAATKAVDMAGNIVKSGIAMQKGLYPSGITNCSRGTRNTTKNQSHPRRSLEKSI